VKGTVKFGVALPWTRDLNLDFQPMHRVKHRFGKCHVFLIPDGASTHIDSKTIAGLDMKMAKKSCCHSLGKWQLAILGALLTLMIYIRFRHAGFLPEKN
jgi:hypothetical protein